MIRSAQFILFCLLSLNLHAEGETKEDKKDEDKDSDKPAAIVENAEENKAMEKALEQAVSGKWELGARVARIWGKTSFENSQTSGAAGLEVSRNFSPLDAGRRYSMRLGYLPIVMRMTEDGRHFRGVLNGYHLQFGLDQRVRGMHRFVSAVGFGLYAGRFKSVDSIYPEARKTIFFPTIPLSFGYALQVNDAISFGPELLGAIGTFRYLGLGLQIQMKF